MATTVGTHVSDFVLGLDDSKSAEIARDLYGRNISLVEVVESLGEYLTSANVDHRRRGTRLMAEVLQMLPSDFLPDKEVGHVSTFLLAKLSDHHSVQPWALHALAAVSQCAGFCDGDLSRQVCRDIFREVHNQSLAQADRRATYTIFYNLLTLHLSDLLPLGDSLVCGYVQQMDGEKDPRNLMLAFRCSLIICHNFALGPMEEEMFEVNSCYFPVDFVPPPNDAHGISREDLSQALSAVMSATPVFAKYCFPLLLEKLSSDVLSAKMDSLKTLRACLTFFDPKDFHEFIEGFSAELIKEVRAGSSEDLVDAALQALTAVASQVSQVPQQLQDFMAETGAKLVRQVESDNQASRLSATRTLCAMAAADGQVCHAVASRLLPAVCAVCQNMSSQMLESDRMFFTEVTSLLNHVANAQNSGNDWGHLQVWGGRLVEVGHTLLASPHPPLQALGMKALSALFTWGAVFTTNDILLGIDAVISRALLADNDTLREESRKAVSRLVQHHPQLSQRVIGSFSHALQSNLAQYHDGGTKDIVGTSASLLAAVAVDNQTGEKVCHALNQLLQSYSPGHEEVMVPVSSGLSTVLSTGHLSADFLATDLLPCMLGFLWPGCGRWPEEKAQLHQSVLSHLSAGWRHALCLMDQHMCQGIVSSLVSQLINGYGGDDDNKCSPLQVTSPWQQTRLVQLLLTVIPRWDGKERSLMAAALSQLPQLALWTKDPATHLQACRCLAALLNHMPPGSELESSVKELCHNMASNLGQCVDLDHQEKALNLLVWVTKAMVVRGHRLSAELTCQLTDALSDPALGTKAAEGFPVILEPFPHLLCTSVGATITPAFQQRFLVHTLPSLLSGFRSAHNEVKENYQLAMVGMLTYVPQQVLVTELPQLMPVLVSSLNGSSASLLREALSAVTAGLQHTPQLLTYYLSDILPQCLTLATAATAMAVRIMAVRCVGEMIHLPATATQPHKTVVLRALKPAIDDPKRLVRKEAVKARTAWCLL